MNKQLLIENLEKKNNIILYFNSGGCGPCIQAQPLVQKIAEAKKLVKDQEKIHKEAAKKIQTLGKIKSFKPMINLFETNQIEGIEVYQVPDEEDTVISNEDSEENEI